MLGPASLTYTSLQTTKSNYSNSRPGEGRLVMIMSNSIPAMNDQIYPRLPQWQVQWRHERPRQRCGLQRRSSLQRGVHRAPASARRLPAADAEVAHTQPDAALTTGAAQSARGRAVRPRAGPVQPPLSAGLAVEQLQVRGAALLSVPVTPPLRVPGRRCGRECRTCSSAAQQIT